MGLDTPDEKMSKSIAVERPGHAVLLLDPPDVIRRKIARATTDTEPAVHKPVGAGVANLLEIYAALLEISRTPRSRHSKASDTASSRERSPMRSSTR